MRKKERERKKSSFPAIVQLGRRGPYVPSIVYPRTTLAQPEFPVPWFLHHRPSETRRKEKLGGDADLFQKNSGGAARQCLPPGKDELQRTLAEIKIEVEFTRITSIAITPVFIFSNI